MENPVSKLFQPFSEIFDPKTGFLTQKLKLYVVFSKKFPNLNFRTFLQKFHEFEKSIFFLKISELRQPNISETPENKKYGKFHLMQGLTFKGILGSTDSVLKTLGVRGNFFDL